MAVTVEVHNGVSLHGTGHSTIGTVRLERGTRWEHDSGRLDVIGADGPVASFASGQWRSVKLEPAD